ncbi:MAG: ATP-binding protein [Sulfitobacter sp.]
MSVTSEYQVLDNVAAAIFVLELDEGGAPVFAACNAYGRDLSGRPLSDYLGHTAIEVYPNAYGRTAFARHCEVARLGVQMTYDIDLPLGDRVRTMRTTLRPDRNQAGKVIRLFGTTQDIHAEKEAYDARMQFETLTSEMEQFVALAAHDLRAPLKNIALLSDMIKEDFDDPDGERTELLTMIENISAKSLDLISDVMAHSQTISSPSTEAAFSFPALCHDICDMIDPQKRHVFRTSMATLHADRTAIQIALRNLIENAIKHGDRDSLEINVSAQTGMPGMIDITLTDNGCGFADEALLIMNGGRFKGDSGYGLFAIKRLISSRGGTLIARNMPDGGGAVVRFSLPGTLLGQTNDQPRSAATDCGTLGPLRAPRLSA